MSFDNVVGLVLAVLLAVFLVIAPGFVAGLAPWWISHWELGPPLFRVFVFRFAGAVLITLGVIGLLDLFTRFAVQGVGTPAPVFPTRHLVVSGLYRYVRNPMYLAVVSTIFGQALLLGNVALLEYGGLVWAVDALQPEGFLVLGSSESIGAFADLFQQLGKRNRLYRRLAVHGSVDGAYAAPEPSGMFHGELVANGQMVGSRAGIDGPPGTTSTPPLLGASADP